MEKTTTITGLMIRHHVALDMMLKLFQERGEMNQTASENLLSDFKWELEKHIFAEERVVFKLCKTTDSEDCKIAAHLSEEHKEMLKLVDKINKDLKTGSNADASGLQKLLIGHRKIEEKDLYPKLDVTLNEKQKELTIQRVNEVSNLGAL